MGVVLRLQRCKHLVWCLIAQDFARSVVKLGGDLVEVGLTRGTEVRDSLWKPLANQPVCVSFVPRCQGLLGSQK